jgi:hypothetical protein
MLFTESGAILLSQEIAKASKGPDNNDPNANDNRESVSRVHLNGQTDLVNYRTIKTNRRRRKEETRLTAVSGYRFPTLMMEALGVCPRKCFLLVATDSGGRSDHPDELKDMENL